MKAKRLERLGNVAAAYRRVFELPDGQVILADMVRRGFVNKTTFVSNDPFQTAWNEGMRSMVLGVLKTAKIDTQKLVEIMSREMEPLDL